MLTAPIAGVAVTSFAELSSDSSGSSVIRVWTTTPVCSATCGGQRGEVVDRHPWAVVHHAWRRGVSWSGRHGRVHIRPGNIHRQVCDKLGFGIVHPSGLGDALCKAINGGHFSLQRTHLLRQHANIFTDVGGITRRVTDQGLLVLRQQGRRTEKTGMCPRTAERRDAQRRHGQ